MARAQKSARPVALDRLFDTEKSQAIAAAARAAPASTVPIEPLATPPAAVVRTPPASSRAAVSKKIEPPRIVWYGRLSIMKVGLSAGSWKTGQEHIRDQMVARSQIQEPRAQLLGSFFDDGVSGAAIDDLHERERCYQAILREQANFLFCEDVDRLGRNHTDVLAFVGRLHALKVRIVTYRNGEPERMLFSFLSVLAEAEREKLSDRVRRSRPHHIAKGRVLGICPYGYTTNDKDELIVFEPEAAVVRFFFQAYGTTFAGANQICQILEEAGVPAPANGLSWSAAVLLGCFVTYDDGPERMNGMLCRRAYIGDRVTGIISTRRDGNGKNVVTYLPKDQHQHHACPPIVDRWIWDLVQKRLESLQYGSGGAYTYLFSGLLRCGVCNGPMTVSSGNRSATSPWGVSSRARCNASNHEKGQCVHTASYDTGEVQAAILRVLHDNLGDARAAEPYRAEFRRVHGEASGDSAAKEAEIAAADKLLAGLVRDKATADADLAKVYDGQIRAARKERYEAATALAAIEKARAGVVTMSVPDARARIAVFLEREIPRNLGAITDEGLVVAVQKLRELITGVTLSPLTGRSRFAFRLDSVFGTLRGAAFARFQNVNAAQRAVIDHLRTRPGGLCLRELAGLPVDDRRLRVGKDTVTAMESYGILERVDGLYRLAVVPWLGADRFQRCEIMLEGAAEVSRTVAFVGPDGTEAEDPAARCPTEDLEPDRDAA